MHLPIGAGHSGGGGIVGNSSSGINSGASNQSNFNTGINNPNNPNSSNRTYSAPGPYGGWGAVNGGGINSSGKLQQQQQQQLNNNDCGNGSSSNKNKVNNNDPSNREVEAYIVQRYISNPYLVGGKKFDLRLYALLMSFNPLIAWINRTDFARFTSTRYSNDPSTIANSFMHLNSVAIQKTGEDYDKRTGGKWDLRRLKMHMVSQFGRETTDAVF